MTDRRTEASRARAIALLVIEKHRLAEAIDAEEEAVEMCRFFELPKFQIAASERRIALLKAELAELQPGGRPTTPTATKGTTDG